MGSAKNSWIAVCGAGRGHPHSRFVAERINADDPTVPVPGVGPRPRPADYGLARRSAVCRSGTAGVLLFARPRCEHTERHLARFAGLMQADVYAGFNRLYEADRKPAPIMQPSGSYVP
jgi:transposase